MPRKAHVPRVEKQRQIKSLFNVYPAVHLVAAPVKLEDVRRPSLGTRRGTCLLLPSHEERELYDGTRARMIYSLHADVISLCSNIYFMHDSITHVTTFERKLSVQHSTFCTTLYSVNAVLRTILSRLMKTERHSFMTQ